MIETAVQRLIEQGLLGILLVLACIAIVKLYNKIEAVRTEKDAEIRRLHDEKFAVLKESLQRENTKDATLVKVLEVVRPGDQT